MEPTLITMLIVFYFVILVPIAYFCREPGDTLVDVLINAIKYPLLASLIIGAVGVVGMILFGVLKIIFSFWQYIPKNY